MEIALAQGATQASIAKGLLESTKGKCKPAAIGSKFPPTFYRHCDVDGYLVHIDNACTQACLVENRLSFHDEDILWIQFPHGTTVRLPDETVPILAGHHPYGRKAILAKACSVDRGSTSKCIITEGRPEQYRFRDPGLILVPVLRYTPDMYPRRHGPVKLMAGLEDGLDATGPYSWKFQRSVSHIEEL